MVTVSGKVIPLVHTVCACSAFLAALATGCALHFHKIVENAHYGYPDEWFPSVSATIGDRYPERSIFQILIALTAFPRFLLLLGGLYTTGDVVTCVVATIRTVTCGGWVYITSTDDHDIHDIFMISYIVLTLPYDILVTRKSPYKGAKALVATTFFGLLVPMLYWYYQHQVLHVPGAYSIYAYFEWSLILLDVAFDGLLYHDFKAFDIILQPTAESVIKVTPVKMGTKKQMANPPRPVNTCLYLLVNTLNFFIFWSGVTSLYCMVWYFPLWYMGISGFEIAIFGTAGCFILAMPGLPNVLFTLGPLISGLITVNAYLVETPETRLVVVSLGNIVAVASFVQQLRSIKTKQVSLKFAVAFLLGLTSSVVFKMTFYSNNPIWAIFNGDNNGYNKTGLVIVLIGGLLSPYTNAIHKQQPGTSTDTKGDTPRPTYGFGKKLLVSLGFGALFYSIHQLLTDASTVIYWCWEGYGDHQGPLQWPWSSLVCALMLLATATSPKFFNSSTVPVLLLITSTAVMSIKEIQEWNKFIFGGIPYIVSILWIVPTYLETMISVTGVMWFTLSFVLYNFFVLAHVWVVAYAFVPGGWLLRERSELVLAISSALIVIGICVSRAGTSRYSTSTLCKSIAFYTVLGLSLIGYFTYQIKPLGTPQPYHPENKLITAGIWTIHFGLDNDMWASEDRMTQLLREMELDVVGLLETDTQRIVMGNRDLTNKMAHDLNMYADFGPGPNKHTWGCVLLSKFPIVNSTHYLLSSPVGELAPAIHATLRTYDDVLVDVFVFHSGQEEDEEDRRLQSEELAALMGSTTRPTILLSYLVTDPHEGNYNTYVSETSGMHDIDPSDDDRWCEYILYKKLNRVGYARVARGSITDTELQVGKFEVLSNEELAHAGSTIYDSQHTSEPINDQIKFPDIFKGDGQRGHFYHVFDQPRYYNNKIDA
ncbi:Cwh43p KNAG_0I00500 [Huiozyma naganishii CBS 8797]|uniref:Calcofluor white hypersensitive protein n=1 Tax=Huiozyma naganishii (strain ATCC MYA-139 / BCRC 22969 / CBS 8797 / KCTC 17520 / NBRC 10181 / NCYC 3082 / Yp74L-3) TaxID=1071383 RepID=J7SA08_HUIN7|nr:hypothetical protein KNAG_0I00500 [Kazachstania naganishii CBS 8797]CCK71841.1 hypothetical protein KNAG_0I00500 [Kazachstania naganishii CBS 8797]